MFWWRHVVTSRRRRRRRRCAACGIQGLIYLKWVCTVTCELYYQRPTTHRWSDWSIYHLFSPPPLSWYHDAAGGPKLSSSTLQFSTQTTQIAIEYVPWNWEFSIFLTSFILTFNVNRVSLSSSLCCCRCCYNSNSVECRKEFISHSCFIIQPTCLFTPHTVATPTNGKK